MRRVFFFQLIDHFCFTCETEMVGRASGINGTVITFLDRILNRQGPLRIRLMRGGPPTELY